MKKILSALVCAFFAVLLGTLFCVGASADTAILTETVNLINANKNQTGDGYYWHNPTDTLTLKNLQIDTKDRYGLRVPDGATIVLEGDSTIMASECALGVEGNLTIKGDGTLTLMSDGYGILCSSSDMNKKLSFYSGSVKIVSKSDGIHSETAWVSQNNDAVVTVYVSGAEANAINARQVKILGGRFEADSPITASDLKIYSANVKIFTDRQALAASKSMSISKVSVMAGDASDKLEKVQEYTNESCVATKRSAIDMEKLKEKLLIFGSIFLGVAVVAAVLLTPYIKHKKSVKKIEAAKAAARVEEKENRRRAAEEAAAEHKKEEQ